MTDKSIVKLNEVDKRYEGIFEAVGREKDVVLYPVSNAVRRAIDLMPDGGSSE